MFRSLQQIVEGSLYRVGDQINTYTPPLIAAVFILLFAFVVARIARWALTHSFRGVAFDRFLRESGIASILGIAGRIRTSRLVTDFVYWSILFIGFLTALNAFGTRLTDNIVSATASLFPKLIAALAIVIGGVWIARYLGRTLLVWASNEGLPTPRRWSAVLRTLITLMFVVIAAEVLGFAEHVFFTAFVIASAGAVLAVSLAFGLSGAKATKKYAAGRNGHAEEEEDESVWQHL